MLSVGWSGLRFEVKEYNIQGLWQTAFKLRAVGIGHFRLEFLLGHWSFLLLRWCILSGSFTYLMLLEISSIGCISSWKCVI